MNTVPSLGEDKLSQLNLNSPRNMKYLPPGTAANHDRVRIMGMVIITQCCIRINHISSDVSHFQVSDRSKNSKFSPLSPKNDVLSKATNLTFKK